MIYGLTTVHLALITVVLAAVTGAVAWWFHREAEAIDEEVETAVATAEAATDGDTAGVGVDLEPPEVSGGLWGLIQMWRHRSKGAKLAKKGYVRWFKLDARMGRPQWVKPEFKGAGEGEYHDSDDDVTYLFPREAMLSDARTGAWVAMHRRNEADPINLRDPVMPAVPADRLQEIINLEAESEQPGFLSDLNLSTGQLTIAAIVVAFLVYAAYYVMNGGL